MPYAHCQCSGSFVGFRVGDEKSFKAILKPHEPCMRDMSAKDKKGKKAGRLTCIGACPSLPFQSRYGTLHSPHP
jgi:hypothetical protein